MDAIKKKYKYMEDTLTMGMSEGDIEKKKKEEEEENKRNFEIIKGNNVIYG